MPKTHAFRLKPGQDLKKEIDAFAVANNIRAGWISCGVGSIRDFNLRFANQSQGRQEPGPFEIVSLTGTVSIHGSHLHISLSDSTGKTVGGHLLDNNIIFTTAEIVLQESERLIFNREKNNGEEWAELVVKKKY